MATLLLEQGDLTRTKVDAVVNAANRQLEPGGGVCGALHAAGGPEIARECREIGRCPTGEARTTTAGELPARWMIHAVGPRWNGGETDEDLLLAAAYASAVAEAARVGARSVAFPAISCGIYGYPLERAADVALRALTEAAARHPEVEEIRVVLFSGPLLRVFEEAGERLGLPPTDS